VLGSATLGTSWLPELPGAVRMAAHGRTEERLALHCLGFASLKTSGAVKLVDAAVLARSLPRLYSLLPALHPLQLQ